MRIYLLEKELATGRICSWAPEEPRESVEHIDATITFGRRCNYSLWRIDSELASQVSQCEQC